MTSCFLSMVTTKSSSFSSLLILILRVEGKSGSRGNAAPSADDVKNILSSVGAEADADRVELLLSQVKGKDITELIAVGREKLASVPSCGGVVAVATSVSGGAAAPAVVETMKEEKMEEKEESDDDLGFSLFD
ncbi:60S acidic ribosomal protein P2-4 [Striga hermonthica]|uniref:60S acidic ribosomal protein P2-4 n=1 Tax=Striga hermonthica TaxID=68872 RepID=A0A9N7NNI4_STRHE|nr:60S acidic ribosomal protein P2-4 [Striga hermonthica]